MVNWNAEKDHIIIKGIFKFHDIKSSGPLLQYLATEIGENCTPKAVSHRLNNIRNHGKALNNGGGSETSTPTKAVVTPKKPAGRSQAGSAKRKMKAVESDDSDGPQGLLKDQTPVSARGKRNMSTPKRSYAESGNGSEDSDAEQDYVPMAKRVKAEPVEDNDFQPFGTAAQDEV